MYFFNNNYSKNKILKSNTSSLTFQIVSVPPKIHLFIVRHFLTILLINLYEFRYHYIYTTDSCVQGRVGRFISTRVHIQGGWDRQK